MQHLNRSFPPLGLGITLQTSRGNISYSDAADQEQNVLQQLTYWQKREDFVTYLLQHTQEIETVVSCYLRLKGTERCRLSPFDEWVHGSFNMCLPVYIDNWKKRPSRKAMIRFPLPYKVGELNYPGNANEKVRCEAATYVWIRENCPNVPIPHLWGFAFAADAQDSKGCSFISLDGAPLLTRLFETLSRQFYSLLGRTNPNRYTSSGRPYSLEIGYLVIDYVDDIDGTMLSASWESHRHDDGRLANLFRDLSLIMLALGKIPLPRIGSFTMDNDGVVRLANRPLTLHIHQLENEGIPTKIDRDTTYATTESYFLDVLSCHDSHLTYQLNTVNDESDCRAQMAALATVRTVLTRFIRHDLRRGPFLLPLTDVHQSNIFVDDEWNIKYIIDLEWACSLPMEMQHPPYWLTSQAVDGLADEELALFEEKYSEFHRIFAHEEALQGPGSDKQLPDSLSRACTMQKGWECGNFFYFLALDSISGLYGIFIQHLQPRFADHFADSNFERIVSSYWCSESQEFVVRKIQQKSEYDRRLREVFERPKKITNGGF